MLNKFLNIFVITATRAENRDVTDQGYEDPTGTGTWL